MVRTESLGLDKGLGEILVSCFLVSLMHRAWRLKLRPRGGGSTSVWFSRIPAVSFLISVPSGNFGSVRRVWGWTGVWAATAGGFPVAATQLKAQFAGEPQLDRWKLSLRLEALKLQTFPFH